MTLRQQSTAENQTPAERTASQLETAVKQNDTQGYSNAMSEVNDYRSSHSAGETKQYNAAVTKQLEADHTLPQVSLFEAKTDFNKIDVSGDGNLQKGELQAFKTQEGTNGVQQALLDNVSGNFDKTEKSSDNWFSSMFDGRNGINQNDLNTSLKTDEATSQKQDAMTNLFAKDEKGTSLYDRLKDKNGDIEPGIINKSLQMDKDNPQTLGLTDDDRNTLNHLKSNENLYNRMMPGSPDMTKDQLQKLATEDGLDYNKLQSQSPDASKPLDKQEQSYRLPDNRSGQRASDADDARRLASDAGESEPYAKTSGDKTQTDADNQKLQDQIKEALTVQKGQSYSQSAEKLLTLAGNTDPTAQQLQDLSHQLWVADGRREAGGLKVNQQLNVSDEVKNNPAVAALFAKM